MNLSKTSPLTRDDLWSLEQYAEKRADFRQQVMQHKKTRQVAIGANATLYFEDRLTLQYQIQEMLRIEKVFEADGIKEELDVYNPMLPTGSNWKATFMIEYSDVEERAAQLEKMLGIEDLVWVQVDGFDKVWAIADEDLDRSNDTKTSAVHFMRFELAQDMIEGLKEGKSLSMGIKHDVYTHEVEILDDVKSSLINDLALI